MASFVNAADAAAAAVEIERRGADFYKSAAAKASGEDKEFFAFMAQEEKRHEGIFQALLDRLGGAALPAGSSDEEYLQYVQGLLDSHTLFMPDQEKWTLVDPVRQSLFFEKDTLLFFMELESMVPAAEQKYIQTCIEEERSHIRSLLKRLLHK